MQDPLAAVAINDVIILDGAMASELERRGCDLNDALWSARVLLGSTATRIVVARSLALMPVLTPYFAAASMLTVKAVCIASVFSSTCISSPR